MINKEYKNNTKSIISKKYNNHYHSIIITFFNVFIIKKEKQRLFKHHFISVK